MADLIPGLEHGRRGPVQDLLDAVRIAPDAPILRSTADEWSVAELARAGRACASRLLDLGVQSGDRIAVFSGNSLARIAWQFGIWWIGAVEVSVNSELRGPMLDHVLSDSRPSVLIASADLIPILPHEPGVAWALEPMGRMDRVETPPTTSTVDAHYAATVPHQLASIVYTSGTSGPSKGVMLSQAFFSNHGATMAAAIEIREGDVGFVSLPMFHVDPHILLTACLQTGSVYAFTERFSLSRFWGAGSTLGATWFAGVGSMIALLMHEPIPKDRLLTRMMCAPVPDGAREHFADAGIQIRSVYGQTEGGPVTFETSSAARHGSAGRPVCGFDVAVLDDAGERVPPGVVGEIAYRPRDANLLMLGYWERPEATLDAWRGLWFHSGDLGVLDADEFLYFRGRTTDSLRRRGENVSAYELEAVVRGAPGVIDCAAVAVIDDVGGEDAIKIVLEVVNPQQFDFEAFFAFCSKSLPAFAVPSYAEVRSTPFRRAAGSGSVHKHDIGRQTSGPGIVSRPRDHGHGR